MNVFEGRHAVVTGVTSGIGLATLERLVASGASVVGIARSAEKLAELETRLGLRFKSLAADLAEPAERARASEALRTLDRRFDFFISNAGEASYESPLAASVAGLRRLFELHVLAPLELCQTLVPSMGAGGHVVQVSSVTARFVPAAKFAPYATTKLAAERLIEALRWELHPRGIRVSVIAPGLVDTPIYDRLAGFADTRRRLEEQVPSWLRPEDVADAIVWMLSRPPRVVVTDMTLMPERQAR